MSAPRFYSPERLIPHALMTLPENVARHAIAALRLRVGDSLSLFDGHGGDYAARIIECTGRKVQVELMHWIDRECESRLDLTLVQALQSGDKMDMTIQKAIELGVSRIVPVVSQRSVLRLSGERAERKWQHWRGVAIAACEQCGRNRIPDIKPVQSLHSWLTSLTVINAPNERARRLCLLPNAEKSLPSLRAEADYAAMELLIGCEGGLSDEERALALAVGYLPVRLGPRVLRTETAGLAALAAIQCLWGDFGERSSE